MYHNQIYYYRSNYTLKVFNNDTGALLTPNDDITLGDYKNEMNMEHTYSCFTFNSKYTTGQNFTIEMLAASGISPDPAPGPNPDGPGSKNTTLIICICVVAIIVIIILTVWCIKRNSAKRLAEDGATDKNQLVQDGRATDTSDLDK